MSGELTFMMGQFAATFPTDRLYARNHMWGQIREGEAPAESSRQGSAGASPSQSIRFGFTAYAVRLLQDVYFLDWSHDAGAMVREKQQIGSIESKKAESDLFSPLAGTITAYNKELLADPSAINVDKYGQGWLFEMDAAAEGLMSVEQYLDHLASVWEVTQRTIKGQLNE
jgi:glycine cleavage system H protein